MHFSFTVCVAWLDHHSFLNVIRLLFVEVFKLWEEAELFHFAKFLRVSLQMQLQCR
jgi:hypothetical protein